MATVSRVTYQWTLECTPPGGVGSTIIFESGSIQPVRPSEWILDQKDDIVASVFEIIFPDALRFFNVWNETNCLTISSTVVLKVDGQTRFTGRVQEMRRNFSSEDRSLTIVCRDRMSMLKDATVDIDIRRDTFRENLQLFRENPDSFRFLAVTPTAPPLAGNITAFNAHPTDAELTRCTDALHGLEDNETILITATTDHYGVYEIQWVDVNTFDILTPFVGADTATWTQQDHIRPWNAGFVIPAWDADPETDGVRLVYSEYTPDYEGGSIVFHHSSYRLQGDIAADEVTLDENTVIFADVVYYDLSDESTMISNLMRLAFETPTAIGGLNWTEDVEYRVTDETPADILSGMTWNTNEGDADAVAFMSNLYDNRNIGLAPAYWMRDFNGDDQVELRLVTQDNDNAKDIDVIFNARFPSPFSSVYSRAVLVNNEGSRANLMRDATITDIFPTGDFPSGDVLGVTETEDHPDSTATGPENLQDNASRTGWGYHATRGGGRFSLDMVLPYDKALFQVDLSNVTDVKKTIDAIYMKSLFVYEGGDLSHPELHDDDTGIKVVNGIKKVHEPMRVTVEYNTDAGDVPDVDTWFIVSADLYMVELDILEADAWTIIDGIGIDTRWLRVIVNNPAFVKTGESNWDADATRTLLWTMNEFIVMEKGRVLDEDGELPTVKFTDDPDDDERCLYDLNNTLVDMFRPTLLKYLELNGLKYKTLVLETDTLWDFEHKTGDPQDVGEGYKYMVSRLDEASKENEWTVDIDPRPDIRIGHTVYSSKIDPLKFFLVHGNRLAMRSAELSQTLILSDHVSVDGGAAGGC